MCIRQMGTARLAIFSMSLSRVPAETSFIRSVPADIAALATADLYVPMLIRVFIPASQGGLIAGITLASSSSRLTCAVPGRVLHPPTSRISAPGAISSCAVDTMLLCACWLPPEKESRVRFRIAIMYVFQWRFEGSSGGRFGERKANVRRGGVGWWWRWWWWWRDGTEMVFEGGGG